MAFIPIAGNLQDSSMSREFIDAYSDDQIFLQFLKKMVEEHPIESLNPDSIKYSSYCRVWSVMAVGAIEAMIKSWSNGPKWRDVHSYLDDRISNKERVERLKRSFKSRMIEIDNDAFDDFLAMKYIRNAYVHSDWQDNAKKYVIGRGFPPDMVSFNEAHFERMRDSYMYIMNRIGWIKAQQG